MILRRLADAIREQNWFTVVLEVFIVVIGIFIGLQVDDWNQARQDRAAEQEVLVRLLEDTQHNIIELEKMGERIHTELNSLKATIAVLEAGTPDGIAEADVVGALCWWGTIIPAEFRTTTYDELVSSGRVNILTNPDLRQQLQMNLAVRIRYQDEAGEMEDIRMGLRQNLRPFLHWRLNSDDRNGASCRADVDAVAERPNLISNLVEIARANTILTGFSADELKGVIALETLLKQEIEAKGAP